MRFSFVSIFPELIQSNLLHGVVGQALESGLFSVETVSLRDYTTGVHKAVDDRPYGGGDGMVMTVPPLEKAWQSCHQKNSHTIYLSPQGKPLTQARVKALTQKEHLILICGRYSGVDERFLQSHVDEEVSVGDFIVSGGELPALLLMDAIVRYIPGVLGHECSAQEDSFSASSLLEAPLFTRPEEILSFKVPEVLLSGHHKKIHQWRQDVALLRTYKRRPDLLTEDHKSQIEGARERLKSMGEEERELLGL